MLSIPYSYKNLKNRENRKESSEFSDNFFDYENELIDQNEKHYKPIISLSESKLNYTKFTKQRKSISKFLSTMNLTERLKNTSLSISNHNMLSMLRKLKNDHHDPNQLKTRGDTSNSLRITNYSTHNKLVRGKGYLYDNKDLVF